MTTYEYVRAQRISNESTQRETSNEEQQETAKTPREPDQSRCECSIKADLILPKSNKIRPSAREEVGINQ